MSHTRIPHRSLAGRIRLTELISRRRTGPARGHTRTTFCVVQPRRRVPLLFLSPQHLRHRSLDRSFRVSFAALRPATLDLDLGPCSGRRLTPPQHKIPRSHRTGRSVGRPSTLKESSFQPPPVHSHRPVFCFRTSTNCARLIRYRACPHTNPRSFRFRLPEQPHHTNFHLPHTRTLLRSLQLPIRPSRPTSLHTSNHSRAHQNGLLCLGGEVRRHALGRMMDFCHGWTDWSASPSTALRCFQYRAENTRICSA